VSADVFDKFEEIAATAERLKRRMQELSKTRAWTHCPACGGKLYGRLAGRRQHLHMACDNPKCHMRMMQ